MVDGGNEGPVGDAPGGQGAGQGHRPRTRARGLAIRRQSVLYTFLLGLGSVLIHLSGLRDLPLVTEGVAFIAIGAVGLIMSWTTQDIGQSIKEAVHEDGELTREGLREVTEAVKEVGASMGAMAKDNKEFFRMMLETQNGIQERQNDLLEKQNEILSKMS